MNQATMVVAPFLFYFLCISSFYQITPATSSSLVIYTYESLFADPPYNFTNAFEDYAAIPRGSVQVIRVADAGEILPAAQNGTPPADILIGLDNVLLFETTEGMLIEYQSPQLVNISSFLLTQIGNHTHLLPYDYGMIAFVYDDHKTKELVDTASYSLLQSSSFTFDSLASNNRLLEALVVEHPEKSSTGLGFLLWTIAVYGDAELKLQGINDKNGNKNDLFNDWKDWWKHVAAKITIVDSWNEAFDVFADANSKISIIVSYSTDTAYSTCNQLHDDYIAILSNEKTGDATKNQHAWMQVEGLGIMSTTNSTTRTLAEQFVDWFLSESLQNEIALHQWVYPANNISVNHLPSCFYDNNHQLLNDPAKVFMANQLLDATTIDNNIDRWLQEWHDIIANKDQNSGANGQLSALYHGQILLLLLACVLFIVLNIM